MLSDGDDPDVRRDDLADIYTSSKLCWIIILNNTDPPCLDVVMLHLSCCHLTRLLLSG